jgi:hypothetical protein
MTEGSKGFGGFSGLSGTRVGWVAASQHREVFVFNNKKSDARFSDASVTPVPIDQENPPNPFEPSVIDA